MKKTQLLFLFLVIILVAKAAAMVVWVIFGGVGLGPDEAQYWTWSQQLDWGYYSKPPGIAWEIWLGTLLFGNTELGVRFGAIVIGSLIPIGIFALAKACSLQNPIALFAALIFALCPLGVANTFLSITDGGMLLFWTLSCIVVAYYLEKGRSPPYHYLGLLVACGALFKWPIYGIWPLLLIMMPFIPTLRSLTIIGGFFISLLGLTPSVIWNAAHDWVTFHHVLTAIRGGAGDVGTLPIPRGNAGEFLGSQIALLSPIIFGLFIIAFISMLFNWKTVTRSILFCGLLSIISFVFCVVWSFFTKIQGNWGVFAYPTGIVLLAWYGWHLRRNWMIAGIVVSILLILAIGFIPYIQSHSLFSEYKIPYRINPFRHNLGWPELERALTEVGYNPQKDFLFSDKYQTTSELSFYSPGQKRAYFLNMQGSRKNQFSFWPSMADKEKGNTGFFVWVENSPYLEQQLSSRLVEYQSLLQTYFEKVQLIETLPLFKSYGTTAKAAVIFRCESYNGKMPPETNLF